MRPRPPFSLSAAATLAVVAALIVVAVPTPPPASSAVTSDQPDINGDGYGDLVVGAPGEEFGDAIGAGTITVLYGAPDGIDGPAGQIVHQGTPGVAGANEARDHWGAVTAIGDFDGDGYDDVAVGAPGEDVGTSVDAGGITVLYGSPGGLVPAGAQVFNQGSPGIVGANEDGDRWGSALASGDFDGDGHDDLAVGAGDEAIGVRQAAGGVVILYGSPTGLSGVGSTGFNQGSPGVVGANESGDRWGASLAAGDFDDNGYDDLLVGAPGEDIGVLVDAGAATLLPGGADGLEGFGSLAFHQATANVPGKTEADDRWGAAVAVGDFTGDGYDDAAFGLPGEDIGTRVDVGAVTVLYGGADGLTGDGATSLHQGSPSMAGANEAGDSWGSVLVAGDVDGDGRDELVIGVPEEAIGSKRLAGAATVVKGRSSGLSGSGSKVVHQGTPGVPGRTEAGDHFGDAAAVVDLTGDGKAEVLVATATESIGSDFDVGSVTLLFGSDDGVSTDDAISLHQDHELVPGNGRSIDYWGRLGSVSRLDLERPPEALRTPTGIIVSVLADIPGGALVRTPCGLPVEVSGGERLTDIDIVIDPGHGGAPDPGSVTQGLVERELNQEIADALMVELDDRGVSAMITRTDNYLVPLAIRGSFADHVRALGMVSIHHNSPASAPSSDPGTEAFIQTGSDLSRQLGGLVYESVYQRLDQFNVAWSSRFDAGVLRVLSTNGTEAYGMMGRPKTPTTLVELTYMANPSEAALIKSSAYIPAMVDALADGIEEFLADAGPGSGFIGQHRVFDPSFAPSFDQCVDPALE